jgi:hypothetical protein
MPDNRAELSGAPEEFDKISATAKLERKKQAEPGGVGGNVDPDEVRTAELRERMKLTPRADAAPATDAGESDTQDLQPGAKPGTERVVKRKSLTLDGGSMTLKPSATNKPTDSKRMLRPKSLVGMGEEEKIQTQELLPHEMDPSRRRETDTANLKRIRPGKTSAEGVTTTGETGTDTIHLRVIKEKKNQLKNILSASQTIRLRPSPAGDAQPGKTPTAASAQAAQAAPAAPPAPAPAAAPAGDAQKRTLKIKAPSEPGTTPAAAAPPPPPTVPETQPSPTDTAEVTRPKTTPIQVSQARVEKAEKDEAGTAMVNRDLVRSAGTAVPTQLARKAPTLQPKTGVTTDTVKLKAPTGAAGATPGAATPPPAPAAATPGAPSESKTTLKIKAPPAATPPPPPQPPTDTAPVVSSSKSTLKIKAPVAPAAGAVTQAAPPAPSPSAETLKQPAPAAEEPSAGGKTLKLKAAPKSQQTLKVPAPTSDAGQKTVVQPVPAPQPTAAPAPAMRPQARTAEPSAGPGLIYTLAAAASLLAVGAGVALMVMQYLQLFR